MPAPDPPTTPAPASPNEAPVGLPPRGWAIALAVGPSLVWCAEYIGSGEVILATRTGAVLGSGVLWAVVAGIVLKYVIGLAGAAYTVTTGEGMMDLFARLPGPRRWAVWLVLVAQLTASVLAIGAVASSAGVFLAELTPLPPFAAGWLVTLLAVAIAWVGEFALLKVVMSALVLTTTIGVLVVASRVLPGVEELVAGFVTPRVPTVPEWALAQGVSANPWAEVLPLLGWGAGGFASQVWYTYWVMGAKYGMTARGGLGQPADLASLRAIGAADAKRLVGWRRVAYADATLAVVIGTLVTSAYLLAGAGVLGLEQTVPKGEQVALTLAELFRRDWGQFGATMFLVGGAAALVSTQFGQVVGWPCLLDDAVRLAMPGLFARRLSRWSALARRRAWLAFFLLSSMTIVYTLGYKPVALVRVAAVLEGLLLTPLQALAMIVGLYWVMPRMFRGEAARLVTPSPLLGVALTVSLLAFTYFCVAQLPAVLMGR
ncbi:MAG: Nramp family divalent metal transporter [Lacipirellulaceae bacterium]